MHRFRFARVFAVGVALLFARDAFAQIALLERQSLFGSALSARAGATPGSHLALRLTLVRIEGSGWTREQAVAITREAAEIVAQCDVIVDRLELETIAAPDYLDFSTRAARMLARLHPVARPAVYLVRDTKNRPAFDAEAIGRGNSRTRPEIADTVWMTAAARDPGVALAHELAHVLMDSGEHSDEAGNLMRAETEKGNTLLSAAQCARLRETGSRNGLLKQNG